MFNMNIKQLFLLIFVGLIATSCDNDSNPLAPPHLDADGFILENNAGTCQNNDSDNQTDCESANNCGDNNNGPCLWTPNVTEVYREFQGNVTINDLNLTITNTLELSVHFLDHGGNEIEHEEEEHEEGEEEDELSFTDYDDKIISLELEEHCDEITDSVECNVSDHCEWHADESACEEEGHDAGDGDEDHHELGFELTGISAGTTTFILSLMHDGHADYTSLPISVTVTQ